MKLVHPFTYLGLTLVGIIPLALASYFLLLGCFSVQMEPFRLALYLFLVSFALTELRISLGGRSSPGMASLTHAACAIPLTLLLIVLGFFHTNALFGSIAAALYIGVLVSGIPLWYGSIHRSLEAIRAR